MPYSYFLLVPPIAVRNSRVPRTVAVAFSHKRGSRLRNVCFSAMRRISVLLLAQLLSMSLLTTVFARDTPHFPRGTDHGVKTVGEAGGGRHGNGRQATESSIRMGRRREQPHEQPLLPQRHLPSPSRPRVFFITYASGKYVSSMARLIQEASDSGDFDVVHGFTREDIDETFARANAAILDQERGGGYWLWKPYFVWRVMNKEMQPGDVLLYADAGCELQGSPRPYIDLARQYGYLGFRLTYVIKHWTKGDVFKALGMDMSTFGNERQMVGGIFAMMKTPTMTAFVREWLHFACQPNLIDDRPSVSPNAPDFVEHRHDQAIYTLLVYKYGLSMVLEDETDKIQYVAGLDFIMKNTSNFKEPKIIFAARGKNDLQKHPENVNGISP